MVTFLCNYFCYCLCCYIHPASVLERAYNLKTVREERVFMFGMLPKPHISNHLLLKYGQNYVFDLDL